MYKRKQNHKLIDWRCPFCGHINEQHRHDVFRVQCDNCLSQYKPTNVKILAERECTK